MPQHLFTPGPAPLPAAVTARLREEPVYHRGPEADALFASVHQRLKTVFHTEQPVLVLSCSGTGGVEAAMLNTLGANDRVLVFNNGRFAKRWVTMLRSLQIPCVDIPIPLGEPVTPAIIKEALSAHSDCTAVWLVHSETSTGTTSDIRAAVATLRSMSDALVCVDAISSVGVHELRMDEWGVDVVVASSQKGLMAPAGLALVALSGRAWQRSAAFETKRTTYFDLEIARSAHERNRTPWTPAMLLVMALDTSLGMLIGEGLASVWQRHADYSLSLRTSLTAAGFDLYSTAPSHAVTAVRIPRHVPDIVDRLKHDFGVTVARGQDGLAESIFRIGHIGPYTTEDIAFVADACRNIFARS